MDSRKIEEKISGIRITSRKETLFVISNPEVTHTLFKF